LQSGWENLRLQPQSEPFGQPQILLERSSLAVSSGVPSPARERCPGVTSPLRTDTSKNYALYGRKIRQNGLLFGRWIHCNKGKEFRGGAFGVTWGFVTTFFASFGLWFFMLNLTDVVVFVRLS